jgi:hypothetical protein
MQKEKKDPKHSVEEHSAQEAEGRKKDRMERLFNLLVKTDLRAGAADAHGRHGYPPPKDCNCRR